MSLPKSAIILTGDISRRMKKYVTEEDGRNKMLIKIVVPTP